MKKYLYLILFIAFQISFLNAQIGIYWTHNGTNKIQRAALDGTNTQNLITFGVTYPTGIAIDAANSELYWADASTNKIQKSNLDGTGVQDVVTGLTNPWGITVNNPCPTASFTASTVTAGTATTFTDASTNVSGSATYAWDFDNDGSTDATTVGNATYTYPAAGTYTAKLTIADGGCAAEVSTISVTVNALPSSWQPLGDDDFNQPSYNETDHNSMAIGGNNELYVLYADAGNSWKATVQKHDGSTWVAVGSAGFSASSVSYTSIAIDGNNVPYVVYKDAGNSNKATVQKYDGSAWVTVGSAGFSTGAVFNTSIAIDGNNVPYVVYIDQGNSNKVTVQKYNGSAWVTVGSAGFSADFINYVSIAIDGNNIPYVVYGDGGNGYKATVKKYDGSAWVTVGSAGFSAGSASYTSIAIDGNNIPYVVYRDYGNSSKATVQKYDGSAWVTVGNAGFSTSSAIYTSIAIDGNNFPYVVYMDGANGDKTTVQKYDGSTWVTVGNAGFSANSTNYTFIGIDGNNIPYVAYRDDGSSDKTIVQKYDGVSWATVGNTGFSEGTANSISVAIDGNDVPYVVYQDGGNSNKATVQKYDGNTWIGVGIAGFSSGTVSYTSIAIDGNNIPYVVYMDLANSYKATVQKYDGSNWVTVGSPGFSSGQAYNTSIAIDENDVPYVVYMDVAAGQKITVQKYDGSSWVTVGSAGFSLGTVTHPSIAIDENDVPYVAYRDGGNSNKATVQKYDGSSWVIVGSAGFSAGTANYMNVAIDGNNIPYIVYQDGGNSNKTTVQKYDGSNWVIIGSAGFSTNSAIYTSIAIDGNNIPYVVYQDGGNSSKATVQKYDGSNWVIVDNAGFSAGTADYTDIAIDGTGKLVVTYNSYGAFAKSYGGCTNPTASFSANTVTAGTATNFTDASTNVSGSATYAWDFDNDGSTDATTVGNTTYTYPAAGTYTAKLTITDGLCSDVTTVSVTVNAVSSNLDFNQLIKKVASDRAGGDNFGLSVSISGDYAIVGAYGEGEDAAGANTAGAAGSAYIFKNDGAGNWTEIEKIVASNRASFDDFGRSVSISGNYAIVGAYREDEDAAGANTFTDAGSAYIFKNDGADNWTQIEKIVASDRANADYFGWSVSISGDYAIVGAYREGEDAAGANTAAQAGSAYIFKNDGADNWTQIKKIVASDRASEDHFGTSVSISGDYAIVGAYNEDEDAAGANTATGAGSAYIFKGTAIALPVELTYFTAEKEDKTTLLTWQTATEQNNKGFQIQRSQDGKTWENIGYVNGNGTTVEMSNYEFTDETPYLGLNYYRLGQEDFDEKTEYSYVRSVYFESEADGEVIIYPNPVQLELTIILPTVMNANAVIYNALGQQVKAFTLSNDRSVLNVSNFEKGTYIMIITLENGERVTKQFVK